jgi:hypothetical protein
VLRSWHGAKEQLVIPAPVLVELDYWIHPGVLTNLLLDAESGLFVIENLRPEDFSRVRELCSQYADSDIGFVDAAVLAVVERLGERKLATLDDRHFGMLRPRHVNSLELLPAL